MKKLLLGVLAVMAVAVGVALAAPSFIDWNAYRAEIAAEVRKATGRDLSIDGSIDVALLPAPKLSLTDTRLSNLEGAAAPDMVRLEALDIRIEPWPLLSGRVVVESVVLKGAEIRLERLADGRPNWDFNGRGTGAGASGEAAPAARGGPRAVSLERVRIEDGTLSYRDSRKGTAFGVDRVDLTVAASSLAGPFAAKGSLRYSGVPIDIDLQAARFIEGEATSVMIEAALPEARASGNFSGSLTADGGAAGFRGQFAASGPDLAALVAALAKAGGADAGTSPMLAREFRLSASLKGNGTAFAAREIEAAIDGTRAGGTVAVTLGKTPTIDATVNVTHFDYDRWIGGPPKSDATPGSARKGASAADDFGLPKDIRVDLDARVGGFVVNKGVVRDVHVQGRLDGGVLALRKVGAALPGGTDASLSGRVRAAGGKPRFDGRVAVDTSDFRALVRWLGAGEIALAEDRLRQVRLRAGLAAAPGRVELADLEFAFDSTRITGGLVAALRERIGIGARLEVDRLNVDAYLSTDGGSGAGDGGAPGGQAKSGGGLGTFGAFDANLNLKAGRLTYAGLPMERLALEGSLVGGDLTVAKLAVADLGGARLTAKGTVAALDKAPVPDLDLQVAVPDPARLLRLADLPVPPATAALKPLTLKGNVKAEATATRVDLDIQAGRATLTAKGGLRDLATAPRLDLALALAHPDFVEFVRLFAPGFAPESPAEGPLRVAANVTGAGLDLKLDDLEARFAEARLSGTASLSLAAVRPVLKAHLKGGEIVLDHFLAKGKESSSEAHGKESASEAKGKGGGAGAPPPWSAEPLDLGALELFDADVTIAAEAIAWRRWRVSQPRLDLTLEDGKLDIRRLAGGMVGGTFHMTGALAAPEKPGADAAVRLDLDVAKADLKQAMFNAADIDVAGGKVDFKMSLTGEGGSTRAIAGSLAGSGLLEARDGTVSGFDLARVNARLKSIGDTVSVISLLEAAMSGGTTRFSRLSGTFQVSEGVLVSDDVKLIADGGTGEGRVRIDIGKWRMDSTAQFQLAGNPDAPPFGLELKGPLDRPRRIVKADALQTWLVSRAARALIRDFGGDNKTDGGQDRGPEGSEPSQPSRDQFIRGILDLLKKQ